MSKAKYKFFFHYLVDLTILDLFIFDLESFATELEL